MCRSQKRDTAILAHVYASVSSPRVQVPTFGLQVPKTTRLLDLGPKPLYLGYLDPLGMSGICAGDEGKL